MPPSRRMRRVNELIRDELAEILRRATKDETLATALISITEVDTAPDLRRARVYYSVYGEEEQVAEARRHLERAAGFLRRGLMERLDLRYTPHLEFIFDESLAQGARIMGLLRQVEQERASEGNAVESASVGDGEGETEGERRP